MVVEPVLVAARAEVVLDVGDDDDDEVVLTGEAVGSVDVLDVDVVVDRVLKTAEMLVVTPGAIRTTLGEAVWTTNVAVRVP